MKIKYIKHNESNKCIKFEVEVPYGENGFELVLFFEKVEKRLDENMWMLNVIGKDQMIPTFKYIMPRTKQSKDLKFIAKTGMYHLADWMSSYRQELQEMSFGISEVCGVKV